jgi:hypothetical protein
MPRCGMLKCIEDEIRRMEESAMDNNGPEITDDEARAAFYKALAYWLERDDDARDAFFGGLR